MMIMKKSEVFHEFPNCDTDMKKANGVRETVLTDLTPGAPDPHFTRSTMKRGL